MDINFQLQVALYSGHKGEHAVLPPVHPIPGECVCMCHACMCRPLEDDPCGLMRRCSLGVGQARIKHSCGVSTTMWCLSSVHMPQVDASLVWQVCTGAVWSWACKPDTLHVHGTLHAQHACKRTLIHANRTTQPTCSDKDTQRIRRKQHSKLILLSFRQ